MYDWIKTDNEFANAHYRDKLVDDPVLAAVIDLLVEKGLVTQEEIITRVNDRCRAVVQTREEVERSG